VNTFTNPEPPPLHVITKEYPQVGWQFWGGQWATITAFHDLELVANAYKHFAKPHDPLPVYEGQQARYATEEDRKGPKPNRYWVLGDVGHWYPASTRRMNWESQWVLDTTYAILDTPPVPDEVTFEAYVYGNSVGGWIACQKELKPFVGETIEFTARRIKK
jgi:hypothetical protein